MKMLKGLVIALACVGFSVAVGCGPDDSDDNNVNASITAEAYFEKLGELEAAGTCNLAFNCPQYMKDDWFVGLSRYETETACVSAIKQSFEQQVAADSKFPEILAAIAAGRTEFDSEKAAACLKTITDAEKSICRTGIVENVGDCIEDAFVPTLAVGAACTTDAECIDGTCDAWETDTCPGKCVANPVPAKRGESCVEDFLCEGDLSCNYNMSTSEYTCGDDPQVFGDKDAACDESEGKLCKAGLACNRESVCAVPVFGKLAASCDPYSLCGPGLICGGNVDDEGKIEGTCRKYGKKDEACMYSIQCAIGLYCDGEDGNEGTCQTPTELKLGEVCDGYEEESVCGSGLFCVYDREDGDFKCQKTRETRDICEM